MSPYRGLTLFFDNLLYKHTIPLGFLKPESRRDGMFIEKICILGLLKPRSGDIIQALKKVSGSEYKILFTIDDKSIIIWAIASMHRKPWYWQYRVNK